MSRFEHRQYRVIRRRHLGELPQLQGLDRDQRDAIEAVSAVFPFRVNDYVIDELIDWERVPDDPMFQLTFPQRDMLEPADFEQVLELVHKSAANGELNDVVRSIQERLNPHPDGQMELNVPMLDGRRLEGLQHKYRETVLFFPAPGQTCHSYCTYCFRWAQFVGIDELKFADREVSGLVRYLETHPRVSDVILTGGDPMVMSTKVLRRYVEPLLVPELETLRTIRIGTKAPAYWPYRFVTAPDADDLLRLFEQVVASGKHLALMAHFSHPRELETPIAVEALRRILATGATVRCQSPLIRHVNDDPKVWADLWQREVELGAVPYYMFIARDTGARCYFEVPLARALQIFKGAFSRVSGLARTVRGPSMSATPGKVLVDGIAKVAGERVFVLKFLQARDPAQVGKIMFARYDPSAAWLDDLRPAFGAKRFCFEKGLEIVETPGYG